MIISLIAAASSNNAIGKNNQLLWHLPNDLKFFKDTTWAMPVLMGRRTAQALDYKPLKGRLNIIITRQKKFNMQGVVIVNNIEDALFVTRQHDYKELMVIGGGEIYKVMMPKANKIYLTRVKAAFENADAFFPEIDESKWNITSNQDFFKDEKHAYDYSFQLWEKK